MPNEIIDSVLAGDKESFRKLVSLYKDGAYNLALSVLKNDFYAKDAVQQAFVNVWLNLNRYRKDAPFKYWFHKILINECYQILRKNPDLHKNFVTESVEETEMIASEETTEFSTDLTHLRYYIDVALEKLSPEKSLALKLFYIESYSVKEINSITGWSVSDTKVKLHRGRKNMKDFLVNKLNLNPEKLYL